MVTWYDEHPAHPARVELSARSTATWAAKTVGLLTDELGLAVGDAVLVDLPPHWVTVGVLAGCWVAGVEVVTGTDRPVAAAIVTPERGAPDTDEVFTVDPASPLQLGSRDEALPGARDLATALRPHADRLPAAAQAVPDLSALDGISGRSLAEQAHQRAGALGLGADARLLWAAGLGSAAELVDAVLAPWSVTGSLVLVTGSPDQHRLTQIAAAEAAESADRALSRVLPSGNDAL